MTRLVEHWRELCADPQFNDCAGKVELLGAGTIVVSPVTNLKRRTQSAVFQHLLQLLPDGRTFTEYALETDDGVRVPDVVWCSVDWLTRHAKEELASRAPEICVEVMSTSNTLAEMEQKRDLYFRRGCEEFILVDLKGFVTFHAPSGQLEKSRLASGFPAKIELG